VKQHGNRREEIFFEDGDQETYRDLLAEQRKAEVAVGGSTFTDEQMGYRLTFEADLNATGFQAIMSGP
jgi:hypothetical protein